MLSPSTHEQKKDHVRTQWEGALYKPGIELSSEADHGGILISNSLPPELWGNKFMLFKPSSLWYFVMVAWKD